MKQPKYNVGDKVFTMHESKVREGELVAVKKVVRGNVGRICECGNTIWEQAKEPYYEYMVSGIRSFKAEDSGFVFGPNRYSEIDVWIQESDLFPSKEELINSL